jgi:hypothetical protein
MKSLHRPQPGPTVAPNTQMITVSDVPKRLPTPADRVLGNDRHRHGGPFHGWPNQGANSAGTLCEFGHRMLRVAAGTRHLVGQ